MAEEGNSAVNEPDVSLDTGMDLRGPGTDDAVVATDVETASCAVENSDVKRSDSDVDDGLPAPLLSVDEALRSITRPTPISIIEPISRAVSVTAASCHRVAPRLLPSVLSHAVAIAVGCGIGWYVHQNRHTHDVPTTEPLADVSSDAAPLMFGPPNDVEPRAQGEDPGVLAPIAELPVTTPASPHELLTPPSPTTPAPSQATPTQTTGQPSPAAMYAPQPLPVRGQFGFSAPQTSGPTIDAQAETAFSQSTPSFVPKPIEVPNDAVSLDALPTKPTEAAAATPQPPSGPLDVEAEMAVAAAENASTGDGPPNGVAATTELVVPVAGVNVYTAVDLKTALDEAHRVVGCPVCKSTGFMVRASDRGTSDGARLASHDGSGTATCPKCGGVPTVHLTSEGYEALCRLAEVATFVRVEADDAETWSLRNETRKLVGAATGKRDRLNKVGRLAGFRLDDPARAQNGVLLAGTVDRVSYLGSLYHSEVVLFGVPRRVTVISEREPPFGAGNRVAVLGWIVDRPVEDLHGYQGEVKQVVWGGLPVVLSD